MIKSRLHRSATSSEAEFTVIEENSGSQPSGPVPLRRSYRCGFQCHWCEAECTRREGHTHLTAATTTETGAEAFRQHWAKRYGFKSGWWKMVERYETALEKNPPHADCESAGHPKRFFFLCDIADAACGKKDALPRSSAMIQRLGVRRQSEVNPGWMMMMMMMMMMMKIVLLVISQAPSRCLVRSWYCVARSHSAFTGWYVEARFAQRKDMTARCKGLGWGDQQIKLQIDLICFLPSLMPLSHNATCH